MQRLVKWEDDMRKIKYTEPPRRERGAKVVMKSENGQRMIEKVLIFPE